MTQVEQPIEQASTQNTRSRRNRSAAGKAAAKAMMLPFSLVAKVVLAIISLATFLVITMCILSWLIAPGGALEFNPTAIWAHDTIACYAAPALDSISPLLPDQGKMEHPSKNGFFIDFTPWVLVALLGVFATLIRSIDCRFFQ